MSKKRPALTDAAINRLAGLLEHGHLMAATQPDAFFDAASAEIERLRAVVAQCTFALRTAHGALVDGRGEFVRMAADVTGTALADLAKEPAP